MIDRTLALLVTLLASACATDGGGDAVDAAFVGLGSTAALDGALAAADGSLAALVLPPVEPGRPPRVVLSTRTSARAADVIAVLEDVEGYPAVVEQVAAAEVLGRTAHTVTFDLELELPFKNLRYSLRYDFVGPARIDVTGLTGPLEGGRWCWEAFDRDGGAIVVYTSESEIRDGAGVVLEQILSLHPDLQSGMAFAQGMRFLRSICAAAEARRTGSAVGRDG